MREFYKVNIVVASLFVTFLSKAQEPCKVAMLSIAGKYEGDCKKGKAHGRGKAEGIDQYLGEFKNGLPDGKGIYRWENGNFYEGGWIKGKKAGEGGMAYKRNGQVDSIVTGFWQNDVYLRKFDKSFKIYSQTLQVSKAEVKFESSLSKEVTILLSNTTGNMPTVGGQITPKILLSDIIVVKGSYMRLINLFEKNKQTAYKLENVIFPFRAKFRFGNQEVDVEFFETGNFTLDIALNN